MTRHDRAKLIEKEDSRQNGLKTTCTSAVLRAFGVTNYHYSQTRGDVVNVLRRHGYNVRSRKSAAGKVTVAGLRKKLLQGKIDTSRGDLVVFVPGHVLLICGRTCKVMVDTDPRKADRRRVVGVYTVYKGM